MVTARWYPRETSHCDSHQKRIIVILLSLYNDSASYRGESKPERRSGKRIIAGTAFRLEFLVGWYYDADATIAVPELH